LLELQASLVRLETLLLIPSPSEVRRKRREEGSTSAQDHQDLDDTDEDESYTSGEADESNQLLVHGFEDDEDEDWWGEEDQEEDQTKILSGDAALLASPRQCKSPSLFPSNDFEDEHGSTSPIRLARRRSSTQPAYRATGRRRSSGKAPLIPRDQLCRASGGSSTTSTTLLPLPLRLVRTAAEHSTLLFLRTRALSIALSAAIEHEAQPQDDTERPLLNAAAAIQPFITAREPRMTRIRSTLLRDLRALLSALLRRDASNAYLVNPSSSPASSGSSISKELESWSQVVPIGLNASHEEADAFRKAKETEQRSWLEFAVRTYAALGQEGEAEALSQISPVRNQGEASKVLLDRLAETDGKREAERAVREVFVAPWAREVSCLWSPAVFGL